MKKEIKQKKKQTNSKEENQRQIAFPQVHSVLCTSKRERERENKAQLLPGYANLLHKRTSRSWIFVFAVSNCQSHTNAKHFSFSLSLALCLYMSLSLPPANDQPSEGKKTISHRILRERKIEFLFL